jgi:hypothetical protein
LTLSSSLFDVGKPVKLQKGNSSFIIDEFIPRSAALPYTRAVGQDSVSYLYQKSTYFLTKSLSRNGCKTGYSLAKSYDCATIFLVLTEIDLSGRTLQKISSDQTLASEKP